MIAKEKAVFCWSTGKDSALALNRILNDPCYELWPFSQLATRTSSWFPCTASESSYFVPVACGTAHQGILVFATCYSHDTLLGLGTISLRVFMG